MVFATYSDADRADPSLSLPDTFLPIQSMSVSFGTNSGLYGAATQHQIWQRSLKNGVAVPYYVASGAEMLTSVGGTAPRGAGAPVLIDVAGDLALPDGISPGMAIRTNVQVQCTVFNNQKRTLSNPQIWLVAITDGFMENKDGSTIISEGGVPGNNIDEFPAASIEYTDQFEAGLEEAGFGGKKGRGWRNFKQFFSGVADGAKSAIKMAAPIAETFVPELGIAAKLLGGRRR